MTPPKEKGECRCGILEIASKEPDNPIRWDERMNEYFISNGKGGSMMVYYCPFCGGRTPESRRASFWAHVTQDEETRIYNLFNGIRTVKDVIARFGLPDEERDFGSAVRHPGRWFRRARGEVFRTLVYKKLSPVADITFEVGTSDSVRGTWIQKYVGDHPGNDLKSAMEKPNP